jgi:gamma-glutamyltranspeptidase/glutathione hydrolase
VSLAPAIRLAREGFELYPRMIDSYGDRHEVMERYAGTRQVFLADGDPPKAGEMLKQPELAHTLELLAARGFDGFYRGEIAARILADVKKYGGNWTATELAGYRVKERTPIRIRYRDWDIVTAPPPSSGGVVLAEILQVLEGWDLAKLDEAHRVHYIVEAMRRAYRDRGAYLGDPDFVKMPIARLTSDKYAARPARLDPARQGHAERFLAERDPRPRASTPRTSPSSMPRATSLAHPDGELAYGSRAGGVRAAVSC